MKIVTKGGIAALFLLLNLYAHAQSPHNYWENKEAFMQAQASVTFKMIQDLLAKEPPSTSIGLLRQSALLHMDWILHDTRLDNSVPIKTFLEEQMAKVLDDMKIPVNEGMKVYKLYNHSFIIKTESVTVAFDLVRGGIDEKALISDNLMQELVKACDVLLITHEHGDHADVDVGRMFIRLGKSVVAPTGLWTYEKGVTYLRSTDLLQTRVELSAKQYIDLHVYPGYQGQVVNNVYRIRTPEGITVAHTGDMSDLAMNTWVQNDDKEGGVDVLLLHSWARPVNAFLRKFKPRMLITGHENELHHSIDHREPYWLNYNRMEDVDVPIVYMTWGERYQIYTDL